MRLSDRWLRAAYSGASWLMLLRPLEALYRCEVARRERAYRDGTKHAWRAPVPVIVVGNLTLGGTGKSPLVAWIGRHLADQGLRPGILSRGYGGQVRGGKVRDGKVRGDTAEEGGYPLWLTAKTPVAESGDEPRMLADQTGLPVVVDPDRPRGARRLIAGGCNVIITDDGLQHHPLARDIEIVVVDGERGFGNGRCLPAGPLREPLTRLGRVDALVINGTPRQRFPDDAHHMSLAPARWRRVVTRTGPQDADERRGLPLTPLPFTPPVDALAGIGNPGRFFTTLEALGIAHRAHPFADHQRFDADALSFAGGRPVVMTAKDAVKCKDIAPDDCWALDVEAAPSASFVQWLDQRTASWRDDDAQRTDAVETR